MPNPQDSKDRKEIRRPDLKQQAVRRNASSAAQNPNHVRRSPGQPPTSEPSLQQRGTGRSRRLRVKYHWFRALVMVLAAVVGSVFLAIFMLQSASDLFGLNQEDNYYDVVVPPDAGIAQVTELLSSAGVVDTGFTFQLYAGLKFKEGDVIRAGEYAFNSNMGYDQIILMLKNGVETDQIVKIKFIEGMTLVEIADELEKQGVCEKQEFLDYLGSTDFNYDFFNQIPESENRFRKLEGYIFPDTYEFYAPEKVNSVAKKFLDNFDNKVTEEMRKRMQAINLTLDETITLASIIQKESDADEHIRRVSSVFHNRLDLPSGYPNLQSDVTILYVENDIKPYITIQNQTMYDAYNTYVCEGLPVAPICNPGVKAIEAALYPAETDYYFFVTDVNMEFYYAQNITKHNQNIQTAAEADQTGMGVVHGIDTQ